MNANVKEFFSYFFGGELIKKIMSGITKEGAGQIAQKTSETIKTRLGGLGVNDEFLALKATAEAIKSGVTHQQILKIAEVIASYPRIEQKNKIVRILGFGEKEEEETSAITEGEGKNKKETKVTKKIFKSQGTDLIIALAPMDKEQIKKIFDSFGASVTSSDVAKEIINLTKGVVKKTIKNLYQTIDPKAKKAVENFDSWLGKDEHNLRQIMAIRKCKRPSKKNYFIFWR
ncbi:hypothetical protein COX69_02235 [Candidatus Falkowbacteria bacterium CG_4_10_14_0_2_um_filter_48_10]|nr:MAG: hypothetical protein COX69_02235 [Candidatus Falkowbacteria bacterium CG_4_10_14_0_2_um_filter_48_10]